MTSRPCGCDRSFRLPFSRVVNNNQSVNALIATPPRSLEIRVNAPTPQIPNSNRTAELIGNSQFFNSSGAIDRPTYSVTSSGRCRLTSRGTQVCGILGAMPTYSVEYRESAFALQTMKRILGSPTNGHQWPHKCQFLRHCYNPAIDVSTTT